MHLLTICIPTFRRSELFARCLESVFCSIERSSLRVQLVIADNCNGSSYDWVWEKFSQKFEKHSVIILSTPVVLEAFNNWKLALSFVAAPHFMLVSDDDMILDLNIDLKHHEGATLFFANNVLLPHGTAEKRHKIIGSSSIPLFTFFICFGFFRPTLCSVIFNSSCLRDFCSIRRGFGRNGDHADGFLILSSLKYSQIVYSSNQVISNYSLEGQGYTSHLNIFQHLFKAKTNFILNCFQKLGPLWGFSGCLWAFSGAFAAIFRSLKRRI
jgi:hypothetical protein